MKTVDLPPHHHDEYLRKTVVDIRKSIKDLMRTNPTSDLHGCRSTFSVIENAIEIVHEQICPNYPGNGIDRDLPPVVSAKPLTVLTKRVVFNITISEEA